MAITHYRDRSWLSPWRELDQMTSRSNRLFSDRWVPDGKSVTWLPPVNVEETRDELVLTAELPGLREADVDIEFENSILTIQGRKEETREEGQEEQRFHLWERSYGSFQRSFTLPRTVLADKISETFQDGVLHVRVPKAPASKGRKIEICSAT